jgi:hypothetical protein
MANDMNPTPEVFTMNLTHNQIEDRLRLLLSNDEHSLESWLTRALTQRLLKSLSNLLLRQSDVDSDNPQAREAATIMEHLAITQRHNQTSSSAPTSIPSPLQKGLLTRIDIEYGNAQYQLNFFVGETCIAHMPTGRAGLHRIIDLIERISEQANWQLVTAELGWLSRKETALADIPVAGHC